MIPLRTVAVLLALTAAAPARAEGPVRRFAVVVGHDEGGEGTRELSFARDDARKIFEIFTRVGGVPAEDAFLMLNARADDVLTALGELERRARDNQVRGGRSVLIFYYSGHAKDGALRLGTTTIPLESLKRRLATAPADVKLGIFDACRSGALTRTKGARRAPAFEVESDATRAAKGLVLLTSSASDEESQESDQLGGSYFSHHLASALLGDADKSGDGRVSLAEAYAYAYDRTVADTAQSAAGPQHPTFSFDLAGNGDLVLTDVALRREGLLVPAGAPSGQYFLVDTKGFVIAELTKTEGIERRVALASGRYLVKRRLPDKLRVGEVVIADGRLTTLEESTLKDTAFSDDPVKGPTKHTVWSRRFSVSAGGEWQQVFDRPTNLGGYFPSSPMFGAELQLHNAFGPGFGVGVDALYGQIDGFLATDALGSLRYRYGVFSVGGTFMWEYAPSWVVPVVGVRVAFQSMTREFLNTDLPKQSYSVLTPGVVLGVRFRIFKGFNVGAKARLHYMLYNVDEVRNLGFLDLSAMLSYEFGGP